MQSMSRVELYAAIRRDSRVDGLSSRDLARKYRVGRRTVTLALSSAWPEPRKKLPPRTSRLDRHKEAIDRILRADLDAPRKQRHTTKRIFDRLVAEHGADGISYPMVRAYVAGRKPEIWVGAGRGPPRVFIPQSHRPGQDAEVDSGDVYVDLAGVRTLCYMFVFRLSFSGKAVHRVFASEGQEAFFEGHVHAFNMLGGVPAGKVRYDNLTSAVARVLGFTRARVETDMWTAFRSWAGLEAFYCQPGLQGAHEKGGVEGEVGRFRRNHLVPVPQASTLAELNALIDTWDLEDEQRRIADRTRTISEFLAMERPLLAPLPQEAFETGHLLTPRADRYAQVTVRMNRYSVPMRLIGRQVASCCTLRSWWSLTAAPKSPGTSAWPAAAAAAWSWTTTWKGSCASPARCPARRSWNRPGPQAGSPRSMTPGGRPRARRTETWPAPGPWSKYCYCTGGWRTSTSSPGSPPRCGPGR